jgi:hypothetical protein
MAPVGDDGAREREVLLLAAGGPVTVASVALRLEVSVATARKLLDGLVSAGVMELDSFDDGSECYRAPGLDRVEQAALAPANDRQLARRDRGDGRALAIFVGFSVLDLVGVGIAALIVMPKWEAEILLWIALAGVPGTLLAIGRALARFGRPAQ